MYSTSTSAETLPNTAMNGYSSVPQFPSPSFPKGASSCSGFQIVTTSNSDGPQLGSMCPAYSAGSQPPSDIAISNSGGLHHTAGEINNTTTSRVAVPGPPSTCVYANCTSGSQCHQAGSAQPASSSGSYVSCSGTAAMTQCSAASVEVTPAAISNRSPTDRGVTGMDPTTVNHLTPCGVAVNSSTCQHVNPAYSVVETGGQQTTGGDAGSHVDMLTYLPDKGMDVDGLSDQHVAADILCQLQSHGSDNSSYCARPQGTPDLHQQSCSELAAGTPSQPNPTNFLGPSGNETHASQHAGRFTLRRGLSVTMETSKYRVLPRSHSHVPDCEQRRRSEEHSPSPYLVPLTPPTTVTYRPHQQPYRPSEQASCMVERAGMMPPPPSPSCVGMNSSGSRNRLSGFHHGHGYNPQFVHGR